MRDLEYWGRGKYVFKGFEGVLLELSPDAG